MADRKMARRLVEVARDPGECTGVRELAEWALRAEGDGADLAELEEAIVDLTDRIDSEMVELPRDADGEPVHVGETVYALDDPSLEYEVSYIEYGKNGFTVGMYAAGIQTYRKPSHISHTRPDSWERIADELEEWCDGADVDGDACEKPRDLADRIRKLAEREGE